jgi:hydroxyacylglutathione hydrolase
MMKVAEVMTRDVVLIAPDERHRDADDERRDLALIGFDRVRGALPPSAIPTLSPSGTESVPSIRAAAIDVESTRATIVDVRNPAEWSAGHVPGAVHVPLTRIAEHVDELREAGPLVLHCQGGARSVIAASVLRAAGVTDVTNVDGGYPAWLRSSASTNVSAQ